MTTIRTRLAAIALALIAAGGLAALSPAGPAVADSSPPAGCWIVDTWETSTPAHYRFLLYECPDDNFFAERLTLDD